MPENLSAGLDLIKELRLRKWARMHYVPADKRCRSWHPIVLDEMTKKDVELEHTPRRYGSASSYVPLPPTATHVLHGPHNQFRGIHGVSEYVVHQQEPAAGQVYYG